MGFGIYTGGTTGLTDGTLVSASNKLTFPSIATVLDAHIRCGTDEYSTQIDFDDIPAALEIGFEAGGNWYWYGIGVAPFYAPTNLGPGNTDVWDVNYPIKLRQVAVPVTADDTFTTDGTVSACTALSTPTLTATVIGDTQIDLSWTNVANEDASPGYTIERSPDGSSWSALTTKAADVTTHSDTGLTAGTHYYYRVKAEGSGRYSDSGWGTDDDTTTTSPVFPSADANTLVQYRFQDGSGTNLNDETANNRDGTISGSGSWGTSSPPGGDLDAYYDFVSTRIAVPSGAKLSDNPGTVECVVKLDATGSIMVLYREGTTTNGRHYTWITAAGKLFQGGANSVTGATTLNTGQWYYLAVAWDGSGQKVFVNGVEDGTAGTSGCAAASDTTDQTIGGRPSPDNDLYLDGKMAFFELSSVKRSGAYILARAEEMGFA